MPEYVVKAGDTLSGIAKSQGLGSNWGALGYTGDPTKLQIGTKLSWGAPAPTSAPTAAPSVDTRLSDFAATQKSEYNAMIAKQNAEQEGLFGQYDTAIKGQETMSDAYKRLSGEAGLPDVQKQLDIFKTQIYGIKDILDRLDENVTSRIAGRDVSEAQRQRIVTAEGNPLQQNLSRFGTAMAPLEERMTAGTNLVTTQLGLLNQDQATALKPLELRINAINDRFAREITGFTTNKETELTGLLDQIQRGRELEDREWQRVQDLAKEERDFQHSLALTRASASASNSGGGIAQSIMDLMKSKGDVTSTGAVDKNSFFKNLFDQGYTQDTESVANMLAQADTIGGSANPFKGMDQNAILAIAYPIRKPYEKNPPATPKGGAYISPTKFLGMGG